MDGFNRDGSLRPGASSPIDITGGDPRNRDSLFLLARVRIGDSQRWTDVRVRNLSAGGLMAEIGQSLAIDSPLELELRGLGCITGRVAWQAEGRTGVAFDVEIDPRKVRKPIATVKDAPPYSKGFAPGH